MADEKFYEQKLITVIQDAVVNADNARKYIEAADKQGSLVASICGRITALLPISTSEANTYINITYGTFKPGRWMSYCTDGQLKELFAMLESTTKELHRYPWRTAAEANASTKPKLEAMNQTVAEVRRVFGDDKARQIVARAKATVTARTGIKF